jgi:hypothetical protein
MLNDFDNTLKQLLVRRVPLDPNDVEISFECPKREWSAKVLKPTVNLYMFDLRENLEMRRSAWIKEQGQHGATGMRQPPVYIDLTYFVTVWARNVVDEHHLLWRVMVTLMREPELGTDILQGVLKQVGPPVKAVTAQADGVLRNPGEFWGALDNDLRPAVTYTATLSVDLDVLMEAPLVLTSVVNIEDLAQAPRGQLTAIGGTVHGRPAHQGGPRQGAVAGAAVTFPALGITVRSGDNGRYVVPDIPEGTHHVRVTTAGGAAAEAEVQVPAANYDLEV